MAWTDKYLNLSAGSNGDGSSGSPWNTFANALSGLGTVSGPTRVNVTGAVTLSANATLNPAGTSATSPVWWRGYTSTPGDADSPGANKAAISGNYAVILSTGWQKFSGFALSGALNDASPNGIVTVMSTNSSVFGCRITNTSTGAAAYALVTRSAPNYLTVAGCSIRTASTSAPTILVYGATAFAGNAIRGGSAAVNIQTSNCYLGFNTIDGCASDGIFAAVSTGMFVGNTIRGAGRDGIRLASPGIAHTVLIDNLIDSCTGYPIYNAHATAWMGCAIGNRWYNCGYTVPYGITENWGLYQPGNSATALLVDGVNHNLAPVPSIWGTGFPGAFDSETFTGYLTGGAVQPYPGGMILSRILTGY